jgi:hypothetical protein
MPAFERAHLIAGGFPPGQPAGHDHDFARLQLLMMLRERDIHTTCANDFNDAWKWLPGSKFLITYVSGPFADDAQAKIIHDWMSEGGRWLALHGSSGGKAQRVGDGKRAMVRTSHHDTLGGFFLNHPPMRRYQVKVTKPGHPLFAGVPETFEVVDELYQVQVLDPANTEILLTTELEQIPLEGEFGFVYEKDTSVLEDGKTRVLGFQKRIGKGGVTYIANGHAHTPTSNSQPFVDESVAPGGKTPLNLTGPWETEAYQALLRNAIAWGVRS